MCLMPPPKSVKSCPICALPVASPHFGKNTWASSANRSRMLPPLDVTPLLSNAFRYSSATDLRCSSVITSLLMATAGHSLAQYRRGQGGCAGLYEPASDSVNADVGLACRKLDSVPWPP